MPAATQIQPATAPAKDPAAIQSMFGTIAPVYDFFNHAFSLNIDTLWRRYAVRSALNPSDRAVLDVACGTGDLTRELQRQSGQGCQVCGIDFCMPMLALAKRKEAPPVMQADGLRLPFPDESFDLVTIGFGLRNMADYRWGIGEMARTLKPGGRLAILDFTTPSNPFFRTIYLLYFQRLLPLMGDLISRSQAYGYLSRSVLAWPSPKELARDMRNRGLTNIRFSELSMGIAVLHIGEKPR